MNFDLESKSSLAVAVSILSVIATVVVGLLNHGDAKSAIYESVHANALSERADQTSSKSLVQAQLANGIAQRSLDLAQKAIREHEAYIVGGCTQAVGRAPENTPSEVMALAVNRNPVGSEQRPTLILNQSASWVRCELVNVGDTAATNVHLTFRFIHAPLSAKFDGTTYTYKNSDSATATFDAIDPREHKTFYLVNVEKSYKAFVEPPHSVDYGIDGAPGEQSQALHLAWAFAALTPIK